MCTISEFVNFDIVTTGSCIQGSKRTDWSSTHDYRLLFLHEAGLELADSATTNDNCMSLPMARFDLDCRVVAAPLCEVGPEVMTRVFFLA
jgi:hypothetical protein